MIKEQLQIHYPKAAEFELRVHLWQALSSLTTGGSKETQYSPEGKVDRLQRRNMPIPSKV